MNRSKTISSVLVFAFGVMLLSIISVKVAIAAQWAKTYTATVTSLIDQSYDSASAIKQTVDGGYIVAGYTGRPYAVSTEPMSFFPPTIEGDFWIIKLDASGEIIWQNIYGGASAEQANSVEETSDGGYVVAGTASSFGEGQGIWILRLDQNGNIVWQKSYEGSSANTILQTSDGGYIVSAHSSGSSGGGTLVLKLDANGNIEWQKVYEATTASIQPSSDGGYVLGGSFGNELWVSKLDKNGNIQGQKIYRTGSEGGGSIQQTSDGGYAVAGYTHSSGDSDIWVLKLNSDGSIAWQKTYGGPGEDWASSFQQTRDGGYIVAGVTYSFGAGNDDIWVLKLDTDGNIEWQRTYGSPSYEWGNSIQQTSDGGYVVAGHGPGPSGFFILKLDSNGDIPGCSLVGMSNATVKDTNATVMDTNVTGIDTNIIVLTTNVSLVATNAKTETLCFSSPPPGVTVSPTQIDYGPILVGGISDRTVTVTNDRAENLVLGAITAPSAPFALSEDHCSNQILTLQNACTFTITFSPGLTGNFSDKISVVINGFDGGEVPVLASGTGAVITLSSPPNNSSYTALSLNAPPTFSWEVTGEFSSY